MRCPAPRRALHLELHTGVRPGSGVSLTAEQVLPHPMCRSLRHRRYQADDCASHREFVPTLPGEAVLTVSTSDEPICFEATKYGESRDVAHAACQGSRVRVPGDQS